MNVLPKKKLKKKRITCVKDLLKKNINDIYMVLSILQSQTNKNKNIKKKLSQTIKKIKMVSNVGYGVILSL